MPLYIRKRIKIAPGMALAAAALLATTPAQAQTVRATGAARYLVPRSVAGAPVRFAGVSKSSAGTQYTYGTDRPPQWAPTTMQAPRTGTWYDVAFGSLLTGRSIVGAVASHYAAGWSGHLTHTALGAILVATNGRVCLTMVGTQGAHAAIIVIVGQTGRDCRAAQARGQRIALFLRARA